MALDLLQHQVSFPTRIENWGVALADKDFFDNQSNLVLEKFKKAPVTNKLVSLLDVL